MMKFPHPDDLNTIETAVWASEYIRRRAIAMAIGPLRISDNDAAIDAANRAVEDLRMARERLGTVPQMTRREGNR